MADKIDNFEKFDVSENQAKAVDGSKLDSYDVREINNERNSLAREIRQAAEFNDDEKQAWFETLADGIDDTDLSAVREFKARVNKSRHDIRSMINSYTGLINKNRDAFGMDKDKGYNAADEYIGEFMKLDAAGKKEWLEALETDITERLEMLRRARELMPGREDYLRTLRRSKVKELVKERGKSSDMIKRAQDIFTENTNAFSTEEKADLLGRLADSPLNEQAGVINAIRAELEERKELASAFAGLPDKYRGLAPAFDKMAINERRNAIYKIDSEITKDYRDGQRIHPLNRHISEDGKDRAYGYFKQCQLKDKAKALAMLDGQFKMEKGLSDEFEGLLEKLGETEEPAAVEKMRLEFYRADYLEKKDKLIPALKEKINAADENAGEEKELTGKYEEMLDKAVAEGHIGTATREKCLKIWEKESMDYKRETVENFDSLLEPYIALFERFNALPDKLKKDSSEFYEAGFKRKLDLVAELEAKLPENGEDKGEDKEQDETAEQINKKRITELTRLATDAERDGEFGDALAWYEEILEINPDDPVAGSRVRELESLVNNGAADEPSTGMMEDLVDEAMKSQDINKQREYFTILNVAADETSSSEAQHGTIFAAKRQKDAEDVHVAEALEKYTEGSSVLNKEGEAEEIMEINADKDSIGTEKLAGLKRPVVKDIIRSSDPTASKNIQFKNSNGQKLSSAAGYSLADRVEAGLKNKIGIKVSEAAAAKDITIDEDSLNEILEKKDMQKLDMSA